MSYPFNRRNFLKGAGGVVVALPFLEAFGGAKAQTTGRPKRILCFAYPAGFPNQHWQPSGSDGNLVLPTVTAPLDPIKHKCLFLSESKRGVLADVSNLFYGHPGKAESAFTGTVPSGAFNPANNDNRADQITGIDANSLVGSPANNESIETFVGRQLRTPAHARDAVNLSVYGSQYGQSPEGTPYRSRTYGFFWEGRGAEVTMEYNPVKAFDDLFGGLVDGGGGEPNPELVALRARRQSVLDAVRENFNSLKRGLGRDDVQRLEAHAERIREIETEIEYTTTCTAPSFEPGELPQAPQNAGESDGAYMNRLFGQTTPLGATAAPMAVIAPLQVKIMAHAMACDIAPVGRLCFPDDGNPFFGVPSVDSAIGYYSPNPDWHNVCHVGASTNSQTGQISRPAPGGPGYYAPELLDGMRFYYEHFADLLLLLDAIPEGNDGESVLDNSLVVLGSDMGEQHGHGADRTGMILAGNFAGGRGGRHLRMDQLGYHDSHILTSIANVFDARDESGAPVQSFGLRNFVTGNVPQIFQ